MISLSIVRRWLQLVFVLMLIRVPCLCQEMTAEELVRQYLLARNETMQANASKETIDKALAYCDDDVVYENPAAKARIEGKSTMRIGMSAYLGETRDARYEVQVLASNSDVVIARVERSFLAKQDDGSWKPGKRSNIAVFEIDHGKIKRILDY